MATTKICIIRIWWHHISNPTACWDPAEGDRPASRIDRDRIQFYILKMANWDDIINNWLTMGRSRQLCYAMNAERRRRENGEEERRPGVMPLLGRGIRPVVPRFQQWDGFQAENFNFNHMARGRSRSFPTPQPFFKYIIEDSPIACHTAWQLDLAMWLPVSSSQDWTAHHFTPPIHLIMYTPSSLSSRSRIQDWKFLLRVFWGGNSLKANCSTT